MFKRLIELHISSILLSFLKQKTARGYVILIVEMISLSGYSATSQINPANAETQLILEIPPETNISGYFHLVYKGNGIDHMNINLVNLQATGLKIGDEIGVFDGIYCVGAAEIEEKNLNENSISIPSSANDTIESMPNGFIQGHKITLKVYSKDIVYLLYFQTVNNSQDIFEKGGSMFAFVDFSQSTRQISYEHRNGIKLYPNPFNKSIRIEINSQDTQHLNCEVFDMNGKLIRTLYNGVAGEHTLVVWDGNDNSNHKVCSGTYTIRSNQTIIKIIFIK